MKKAKWELPEILKPEIIHHEKKLNKAFEWVEKNKAEIHPSISFIQSVELYNMGIDVTQLKPKHTSTIQQIK